MSAIFELASGRNKLNIRRQVVVRGLGKLWDQGNVATHPSDYLHVLR